jgi:hypothetical protein
MMPSISCSSHCASLLVAYRQPIPQIARPNILRLSDRCNLAEHAPRHGYLNTGACFVPFCLRGRSSVANLAPIDDQALGGGIMWVSGHMYLIPILILIARFLKQEEAAVRRSFANEAFNRSHG